MPMPYIFFLKMLELLSRHLRQGIRKEDFTRVRGYSDEGRVNA